MSETLLRRTSVEQSGLDQRVLVLPLGSFEQHGAHLPLATDAIIAAALCNDVAARRTVDVAPVLNYGASGEHAGFAGLLSLGTDATAHAITELIRSARDTWRGVVLVCAHGGNAEAVARVLDLARAEGDQVVAWFARDPTGDAHAGLTETSVVLSIDPTLVRLDALASGPTPPDWVALARAGGVRAVSESGVLGDPHGATAERGWELRERWCAEVVEMIDEMRAQW